MLKLRFVTRVYSSYSIEQLYNTTYSAIYQAHYLRAKYRISDSCRKLQPKQLLTRRRARQTIYGRENSPSVKKVKFPS